MIGLVFSFAFAVLLLMGVLWGIVFLISLLPDGDRPPKPQLSDKDQILMWLPCIFFFGLYLLIK